MKQFAELSYVFWPIPHAALVELTEPDEYTPFSLSLFFSRICNSVFCAIRAYLSLLF